MARLHLALQYRPGNIGIYEASIVGAVSIMRIPAMQKPAFAIASHSMNWITMSLLGVIGLSQLGHLCADMSFKIWNPEASPPESNMDI